ncbi:MAG: MAPEG family protein [Gammaproteobacteria bacterium]
MDLVYIVIALALLQYFIFCALVGRARIKYEVAAPAMTGHEIFERYARVQGNTMEQLVIFVPAMLLFGYYISSTAAAVLGLVFITGRFLYLRSYVSEPAKRGPGFGLSMLPMLILLLGGLGGALWTLFG